MPAVALVEKSLPFNTGLGRIPAIYKRGSVVLAVGREESGVYFLCVSSDDAASWVKIPLDGTVLPGTSQSTLYRPEMLFVFANGAIAAVGSQTPLFYSNDYGVTWLQKTLAPGLTRILPRIDGTALFVLGQSDTVWELNQDGTLSDPQADVAPGATTIDGLHCTENVVFAVSSHHHIYTRAHDTGGAFTDAYYYYASGVSDAVCSLPTDVAVSLDGSVVFFKNTEGTRFIKSSDGGLTWTTVVEPTGVYNSVFWTDPISGAIYAKNVYSGDDTLSVSTDNGESFTAVCTLPSNRNPVKSIDGILFSAIAGSPAAYSLDQGSTWVDFTPSFATPYTFSDRNSSDLLYYVANDLSLPAKPGYYQVELIPDQTGSCVFPLPPISVNAAGAGFLSGAIYSLPTVTLSAIGAEDPRYVYTLDYVGAAAVSPTPSGLIAALAMSTTDAAVVAEVDALVAAIAISNALAASVLASQTIAGATAVSLVWLDVAQPAFALADVWAMNAETGGFTRYEGFDFNSYAKIDGAYFGCKEDGIYQLDGQTDAGVPIRSMVSFGKQGFGTSALKRITNAYVGVSGQGRLFLKVRGEGQEYTYAARSYDEALQVQRFDTGKGLRVNWLEFELYNADGEDFELASVEFAAVPTSRRI